MNSKCIKCGRSFSKDIIPFGTTGECIRCWDKAKITEQEISDIHDMFNRYCAEVGFIYEMNTLDPGTIRIKVMMNNAIKELQTEKLVKGIIVGKSHKISKELGLKLEFDDKENLELKFSK